MIESRCGILCGSCPHREAVGCGGCTAIDKPFWGDRCPVKACCEERSHAHCGQCPAFPCEQLHRFAYDPEQGDGGARIAQCGKWLEEAQDGV